MRAWHAPMRSLVFFFFLIILPVITAWLACTSIQDNLEKDQQKQTLDEMAEMTAHMARLTNPETYFQDSLRRLSDSFRWASATEEIHRPFSSDVLELFLFDSYGNRIAWPGKQSGKKKISEDYLKALVNLHKNPATQLNKREQSNAAMFSGNFATIRSLANSPETLVSFQGIGLRRLGAWFDLKLPGKTGNGYLLAWLHLDNLSRYQLAEQAIHKIQRLAGKDYIFSWIDLNDPLKHKCTQRKRLGEVGLRLLANEGLKSGFRVATELFALTDTPEGIRLICSRSLPTPPNVLTTYFNLLRTILPVLFLFLIWKTVFMVRLDLSVRLQFAMIFGFTALTGIMILLVGTVAYQYEKQNSLIADYKQRAVEILEKIDRNFSASYGDLLRQYRNLNERLKNTQENPQDILAPLTVAQKNENIAFAGYTDKSGNLLFRAPESRKAEYADTLEGKYTSLITNISGQIIRIFNSSKIPGKTYAPDPIGLKNIANGPVEGLLANRSTLQNITFDGDETLTFMDLTIDESDTASACLFIIHEPRKMQLKYLAVTGQNLSGKTGFGLAAFPKRHADRNAYYPRFSFTAELPLWKLQDMVNQTQVSCFKRGRIDDREVLVAAISGHNLKNYNLFLIIPFEPIRIEAGHLSGIFVAATILSLIFIVFLSSMLIKSLITPITMLAANTTALKNAKSEAVTESLALSESNELGGISTGLTDLILKVREFNEGRSVKRHLLPPDALLLNQTVLNGFQINRSNEEKEIYHFAIIGDSLIMAFMMRTDLSGIEASLTLSMARMAVKLISEELNVYSAYHCLKDLEEYFRINLRRKLGGDFIMFIINHEEKKLSYSGCGAIKLATINTDTEELNMISLPQCELGSTEFHKFNNQEIAFGPETFCLAISAAFSDQCCEKLTEMKSNLCMQVKSGVSLLAAIHAEAEKTCAENFLESASMIVVQNMLSGKDKQ